MPEQISNLYLVIISGVLGLVTGSFLNVVINRLNLKEALTGRSHCPHCKKELQAIDLVPVISFLFLAGKCRYCGKLISWQYPIVEALTGLVFILIALKVGELNLTLLFYWVMAGYFIVIGVYDYKHYLILDKLIFPALGLAVLFALYMDVSSGCGLTCLTLSGIIGISIISGFFLLQHLVSKGKWIGFGDVKYGLLLGMVAGFPLSIFLVFTAYMSGAIVGVYLMLTGLKQRQSKLPFGAFLSFAAIIAILWGYKIIDWYMGLIGIQT
jgi:leader peptidase (prepilin peptidase)/N-methyltransferase